MRPAPLLVTICLFVLPTACAQFPELDERITDKARQADRPVLTDNAVVLEPASEALLDTETRDEMLARAAALQARAEAASGPVISPEEKAELLRRAAELRAEAARVAQES
ncbi:hypothetical protein [Aliiruegeria sabulilitoris]|uniref:hypothetical protein n=1 Tax=Aliiruegeria sabulilitoris TaxID=1510458 RepID=UPI000831AAC3|nr:hypothetical protein [Aliiruegeria sabulilitoris]NDR59621.1 hypothetical protein [Pseudoruegeria sp. M32A2M]